MRRPRLYVEERWYRRKDGTRRGPYLYKTIRLPSGRRLRNYMRRGPDLPMNYVVLKKNSALYAYRRAQAYLRRKYCTRDRPVGRPSFFPAEVVGILRELGFRVRGKQIQPDWSHYLEPEAVALRFELLPIEQRTLVGSPERLAEITVDAKSRLRSANRNRRPTTFESCFMEALLAACPNAILAGNPSGTDLDKADAEAAPQSV
jgi:hypothetical protein